MEYSHLQKLVNKVAMVYFLSRFIRLIEKKLNVPRATLKYIINKYNEKYDRDGKGTLHKL